jgi:hypothetical protein
MANVRSSSRAESDLERLLINLNELTPHMITPAK